MWGQTNSFSKNTRDFNQIFWYSFTTYNYGIIDVISCTFTNPNAKILENLPYIFIAWLLVSLDITLKLGVIESLTKLITGLKDLSK